MLGPRLQQTNKRTELLPETSLGREAYWGNALKLQSFHQTGGICPKRLSSEVTSLSWILERLVWEVPGRRTRSTVGTASIPNKNGSWVMRAAGDESIH